MSNTTNWVNFPVSVDGVNFISRIDKDGSFYPQIIKLPSGVFEQFHTDMIHELIGNPSLMSREDLLEELEVVNAGATQAIIDLA